MNQNVGFAVTRVHESDELAPGPSRGHGREINCTVLYSAIAEAQDKSDHRIPLEAFWKMHRSILLIFSWCKFHAR